MTTPKGPYKLVTVNTAPERAFRLVGRVADGLKDKYTIKHVANCSSIDEVADKVAEFQPDLLFCASMWTPEQAQQIIAIAKEKQPTVKAHAIPQGLQVERGPDAIVEHLTGILPPILDTMPEKTS